MPRHLHLSELDSIGGVLVRVSAADRSATGLSVIDGLGLPSGRPRCDIRMTAKARVRRATA